MFQALSFMVNKSSISSLFLMYEKLIDELDCLLTPQMSAKKGLKVFGERGAEAIM